MALKDEPKKCLKNGVSDNLLILLPPVAAIYRKPISRKYTDDGNNDLVKTGELPFMTVSGGGIARALRSRPRRFLAF